MISDMHSIVIRLKKNSNGDLKLIFLKEYNWQLIGILKISLIINHYKKKILQTD